MLLFAYASKRVCVFYLRVMAAHHRRQALKKYKQAKEELDLHINSLRSHGSIYSVERYIRMRDEVSAKISSLEKS